jgi:uncharacterized protein (DUF488 family)
VKPEAITLYTIGHSTRTLEEFTKILHAHSIHTLVDIRAFPMSRRLPHFNREALELSLAKEPIQYLWMKELGGRRKKLRDDSPNIALRNDAFRNYADYMLTPPFEQAAGQVLELAGCAPTAIMCAEKVFFHCHRMLVSDYFALRGDQVLHIQDASPPRAHAVTKEARLADGKVVYDAGVLF